MMSKLAPVRALIDFALPARCAACGSINGGEAAFCVSCWSQLTFFGPNGCQLCGIPMAHAGLVCGPCLAHPPSHDGVIAAVAYGDIARDVALKLKYGRRIGLAAVMGRAMARLVDDADALLVPVPLHRWRIWRRGFNQSALLARAVSNQTGQSIMLDAIERKRATPPLGGLGADARRKAMRGAFRVPPKLRPEMRDKAIMLVDDVYTSGATTNACALALKRAGARRVRVLCWARVLKEDA